MHLRSPKRGSLSRYHEFHLSRGEAQAGMMCSREFVPVKTTDISIRYGLASPGITDKSLTDKCDLVRFRAKIMWTLRDQRLDSVGSTSQRFLLGCESFLILHTFNMQRLQLPSDLYLSAWAIVLHLLELFDVFKRHTSHHLI